MNATIKSKKEIAKDTLQVEFKLSEPIDFTPGQFFFIDLIDPPYNDEKKGNQRHFSFVNSPDQTEITMATRIRKESPFKQSLKELPIGTEVEIGSISGQFTLPKETNRPLVFIAGGIGITPFISMLRHIKNQELNYSITLLYANKNIESSAFLEELQTYNNIKLVPIMSDDQKWQGESRMIDSKLVKEYFPEPNINTYFISGAPSMVNAVSDAVREAGVNKNNIKTDSFTGY